MKSYTCYPGTRTRFQPLRTTFVTPDVSFTSGKEFKTKSPSANIIRKEGSFEIHLAVPGLSKDKIRIEMIEDQLVVTAINADQNSTKGETASQQPRFLRHEFDYSGFKRTFRLQKNANATALTASFNQGILTIVIPDKEPETIKINIQ